MASKKKYIEESNFYKAKISEFIYDINVRKILFFLSQINIFLCMVSYNKTNDNSFEYTNSYDNLLLVVNFIFFLDPILQVYVHENIYQLTEIYNFIELCCSILCFASVCLVPLTHSFYEKYNLLLINGLCGCLRTWVSYYAKQYQNPFKIIDFNHRANIIIKDRKDNTVDLCYVTNNLIALSFPHSVDDRDPEHKNKIDKVAEYLNKYHANNYKVYNLCMEKQYNPIYFNNNVERFPIHDYDVPSLSETLDFFKRISKDFASNKHHVKAFHCMGGKGRTGTIMSMYLLFNGTFINYEDSMRFFAIKRTFGIKNTHFKGVETPSQQRFVKYFEEIVYKYNNSLPRNKVLGITQIVLKFLSITRDLKIKIESDNHKDFYEINLAEEKNLQVSSEKSVITVFESNRMKNEVKLEFLNPDVDVDKNLKFSFTFHTAFVEDTNKLVIKKNEIDDAEKNFLPGNFEIEIYFKEMLNF